MKNKKIAETIKTSFFEGYNSYATQACAFNTAEEAWDESDSKEEYDKLLNN